MAARRQPEVGADRPGASEAAWFVDRGAEGQGIDRPDPRHGHGASAVKVVPRQGQKLTIEAGALSAHDLAHAKEGTYRLLQQAMLTNEFLGPAAEEVATGFANDQAMVLEQATDLVLEIALDLN